MMETYSNLLPTLNLNLKIRKIVKNIKKGDKIWKITKNYKKLKYYKSHNFSKQNELKVRD